MRVDACRVKETGTKAQIDCYAFHEVSANEDGLKKIVPIALNSWRRKVVQLHNNRF